MGELIMNIEVETLKFNIFPEILNFIILFFIMKFEILIHVVRNSHKFRKFVTLFLQPSNHISYSSAIQAAAGANKNSGWNILHLYIDWQLKEAHEI